MRTKYYGSVQYIKRTIIHCLTKHPTCLAPVPLIGCFVYKFNLFLEACYVKSTGLVNALKCVHELMLKLHTLNSAAKRHKLAHLGAFLPIETCWSGKYEMVKRFFRLETALTNI